MSEPQNVPETTSEEMPPVTPEAVSLRIFASAYLATVSRRKGDAFLREVARLYADEESMANIFPIRPPSQRPAVTKARRQSLTWFRTALPLFLASMRRR